MEPPGFRLGLDEAGYGPTLGPLTVGVVRVDRLGQEPLEWPRGQDRDFPAIHDSKQLHRGPDGLARLERTALAALRVARPGGVRTLEELLGKDAALLEDHPWYRQRALRLPCAAPAGAVDSAAAALEQALAQSGLCLSVAEAAVLPAGSFNVRLAALENKALVEQEVIEHLLERNLPASGSGEILCDRLGGRRYYGSWLASHFPLRPMVIRTEGRRASSYEIEREEGSLKVSFLVGGESRSPEIALASCLAKYHRELLMLVFNRFWAERVPGLRPTAGYPQDARRFLRDISLDPVAQAHPLLLTRQR